MAKVLCIEDEAEIRALLVEELSEEGHDVVEAADGLLGLTAITQHKPDVVLCDITMPNMDGHALLHELRTNHPEFAELPFIFLSALADRQQILEGKKLGADDYLTKPIDFELLIATLEARLAQVRRMKALKDEQFVKLYKSLQPHAAPDGPVDLAELSADESERPAAPHDNGGGPAPTADTSDGENRIKSLASAAGRKVVAAVLRFVGLDDAKSALGVEWPSQSKRLTKLAQTAIQRRLSSEDVLEVSDDGEFVICFAELDAEDGADKVQSIAHEVWDEALDDDELHTSVKEDCAVAAEVHEVELTEDEIGSSDAVLEPLMERLDEAEEIAREMAQAKLSELVDNCKVQPVPATKADGGTSAIAVADFDMVTKTRIAALRRTRPASADLTAEIDILKLGRCAMQLSEGIEPGQPTIVVDVGFSTLNSKKYLERYLGLCSSFPDDVKKHLALNLRDAPIDRIPDKVVLLIKALRRICRMVMLDLNELSFGAIDPAELKIPVVTSDHYLVESWIEKQPKEFKRLIQEIHEKSCRLLVYDAPRGGDVSHLVRQGVDLVACGG